VRPRLLAPCAVLVVLTGAVASDAKERGGSSAGLQGAIDRVVGRSTFAGAFWGIEVRSLRTGKVLYARNAEKNFKPASTLKLVTTAAALDAFGPDLRLRTTLETAARRDAMGRILGDVFLVGRGDPELAGRFAEGRTSAGFEELAEALKAAGVRRIEGRLVGHEGLFTGERRGTDWAWGDLVWRYGAEVSALSFSDNAAILTVSPGERAGDPVMVDRFPETAYYRVVSTATTSSSGGGSDLVLERDFGTSVIRLGGTVPLGGDPEELGVALEDPARYAATVFTEVLESKGIRVLGGVATSSDPLPPGVRVLAGHDSPPLSEILKGINKPSQNLHTEMLLRLLGARVKGAGTVEAGHAAVMEFLRRVGVSPQAWALQDASGLSRSDLVSPHEMVSLLAAMDRHRYAAAFRDSLPIAGVDGTLEHRMRGSAQGRVVAKTGTIRHVNALDGYATARGGERLAFAIVVNHHTGDPKDAVAAIDEIGTILAGR
jgi:D-alanyl-D-alanine carboxypeptidase/D-alanyl-D-alanine-endopeptidase (penicillin-binding protein 4)